MIELLAYAMIGVGMSILTYCAGIYRENKRCQETLDRMLVAYNASLSRQHARLQDAYEAAQRIHVVTHVDGPEVKQ